MRKQSATAARPKSQSQRKSTAMEWGRGGVAAPPSPTRAGGVADGEAHCPGRKPPFLAVKRPASPCRSAKENRFTAENLSWGRSNAPGGPVRKLM